MNFDQSPSKIPSGPTCAYNYGPQAARQPELEVLLTDGMGSFAQSSLGGVPTRRYSGLVVSHAAPDKRYSHIVSPLEQLELGSESVALHALEIAPGIFEGRGLDLIASASVWELLPEREQLWRGVQVRRHCFMPRESGSIVYMYEVSSRESVTLTLGGFFADREANSLHSTAPNLIFQASGKRVKVQGKNDSVVRLHVESSVQSPTQSVLDEPVITAMTPVPFSQRIFYRAEEERSENSSEYLRGCQLWRITLPAGGGRVAISIQGMAPNTKPVKDPWKAYSAEIIRRRELAAQAWQATGIQDSVVATLAIAADSYIVKHQDEQSGVVAGYPWLTERGRDAMISLTGLSLVTGRASIARDVTRNFFGKLQNGLLPNSFDGTSSHNTADGALWMAVMLERYVRTLGDGNFAREMLPALRELLSHYHAGTSSEIQFDSADGLLKASQHGVPLTWMDTKIYEWLVTPRQGKPVEIQALWLTALGAETRISEALGEKPLFADLLSQARQGFGALWQNTFPGISSDNKNASLADLLGLNASGPGGLTGLVALGDPNQSRSVPITLNDSGSLGALGALDSDETEPKAPDALSANAILADVLTESGLDLSVRPNALIALALADTPASNSQIDAVILQAEGQLLTPMGLHSLSPLHSSYLGNYGGAKITRDAAEHQGTVWPWTMGGYIELLLSRGQVAQARTALNGLIGHIWEAGIGHVSEVFSGDRLTPAGCPFYACSVAELLRAHVLVSISEIRLAQHQR